MVRLILEEGGQRRAFKVNQGKLTIGSAESCTLTIASEDVAENHAELEIAGDVITLKPRPGVLPPMMFGQPVKGERSLTLGSEFSIGDATFRIEDPNAPTQPVAQAAAAPAPARAARHGHKTVGTPRTLEKKRVVERTRPVATIKHGMPSWLIVLLIVGGLGLGGFALLNWVGTQSQAGSDSPATTLKIAEDYLSSGNRKLALARLDMIDNATLPPDLRPRAKKLRQKIDDLVAEDAAGLHNREGTTWLETQLKRFETNRLQGNPETKKIRVFLMRCREFRQRWPDHDQIDWVTRQESRFRGVVDISGPATFEEIAYEIETLTWSWPQRYEVAFAKLEPYRAGSDAAAAEELFKTLTADRVAKFDDRMQQAKYEWFEKKDEGKAVETLRAIIVNFGDEAMVSKAATELVQLPGIESWLESYQRDRPNSFNELMQNSIVRAKAGEYGLLEKK